MAGAKLGDVNGIEGQTTQKALQAVRWGWPSPGRDPGRPEILALAVALQRNRTVAVGGESTRRRVWLTYGPDMRVGRRFWPVVWTPQWRKRRDRTGPSFRRSGWQSWGSRIEGDTLPKPGDLSGTEIEAAGIARMATAIENFGAGELARRALFTAGQIFRFAIAHARRNPAADFKPGDVLREVTVANCARIEG